MRPNKPATRSTHRTAVSGGRIAMMVAAASALVAVPLVGSAVGTNSASPAAESATATMTVEEITSRTPTEVGSIVVVEMTTAGQFTGDFIGTFEDEFTGIEHPSGVVTAHGTITCECTYQGQSGTVTFMQWSHGNTDNFGFAGRALVIDATDDLTGLTGWFQLAGTLDPATRHATVEFSGRVDRLL